MHLSKSLLKQVFIKNGQFKKDGFDNLLNKICTEIYSCMYIYARKSK
jgi:hypothetical protein